jgi:hypothetical protein
MIIGSAFSPLVRFGQALLTLVSWFSKDSGEIKLHGGRIA